MKATDILPERGAALGPRLLTPSDATVGMARNDIVATITHDNGRPVAKPGDARILVTVSPACPLEMAVFPGWPWIALLIASGYATPADAEMPPKRRFFAKPYSPHLVYKT